MGSRDVFPAFRRKLNGFLLLAFSPALALLGFKSRRGRQKPCFVLMEVAAGRACRFELHFRLPEFFRDQVNDIIFNLESAGNA
jgi:hypothetical protein